MISICITIKNRSRELVGGRELLLFPNCVRSIAHSRPPHMETELVVSDWDSDDWPLSEWLIRYAGELPVTIIRAEGLFSRGRGRNIAARAAQGESLLFLDADSILSESVLTCGDAHVRAGRGYFPIIYGFKDPDHTTGFWRVEGYGNCMVSRRHFEAAGGWPDYSKWGYEDNDFHTQLGAITEIVRETVPGFYHQWHPNDILWKDRFGERDSKELEELRRVAETCRDLESALPPEAAFVLLDEDRFGNEHAVLSRARPFIETNGLYGGPPVDGHVAVRELERMYREGTRYVAVTWIAHWWMEHYQELHQRLEAAGRIVLRNERLVLYELL